ncbi:MAG: RlmE family RNA methyltransferase [Rickettsiaceae bacterium]|nr:RlmE family RNA methyltransferase [Rickettsiaceae bacterium]
MRLKVTKVKTAKQRSLSSSNWLRRQLNDEYVLKAQAEGYRSRAAYKLIEINQKFRLIKRDSKIIDLGASPGGWSQVASKIVEKNGKIVAIDLIEMGPIQNVEFIQGDFCAQANLEILMQKMQSKASLILSDMAPNTTGHKATDHLRIIDLCERVVDFADLALAEGGNIVVKIFQGGAQGELTKKLKTNFDKIKYFKPESSRKDSSELYLIALGYNTKSKGVKLYQIPN